VRGHHQHRAGECHSEHQVRRLSDQVVRRSLFFHSMHTRFSLSVTNSSTVPCVLPASANAGR
jgi:hypothetical protein